MQSYYIHKGFLNQDHILGKHKLIHDKAESKIDEANQHVMRNEPIGQPSRQLYIPEHQNMVKPSTRMSGGAILDLGTNRIGKRLASINFEHRLPLNVKQPKMKPLLTPGSKQPKKPIKMDF